MSVHTEFLARLLQLVEYAEAHDLEVPTLALNAALEVIAPNMVKTRVEQTMRVGAEARSHMRAYPPIARMAQRKLQVINGGLNTPAHG